MGPKTHEIMRRVTVHALRAVDIALVMFSFGLAAFLSTDAGELSTIANILARKISLSSSILFSIAILMCYAIFSICGLYESKRLSTKAAETFDVLRAMTLVTAFLWMEGKLCAILLFSPAFLEAFWAIGSVVLILSRIVLRTVLGAMRKRGRDLHRILVLGTNPRAIEFARAVETMPERGYRVLGFVDEEWPGLEEFHKTGYRLVCSPDKVAEFLRHNVVDEMAIYLPLRSYYQKAAEMAKLVESHGILLRFDSDIFDLKLARPEVVAVHGDTHLMARSGDIEGWQLLLKRVLDVVGATVLLIALAPLLLVVAIIVKLTSPGPILFAQKRVGLNKRQFTMFKFRTMISSAEGIQDQLLHLNEMSGPVFKIKNDPRVTPVGKVLRKTSIDELPQLFNVLKGDMSLVGPRAMSVRDYQFFSEDWQRRRFSVPPGITCLWQVQGRNEIPFEQWMMLDMQYIDRWSLWLDLKILAQTIPAVFKGS